jgi:hypothetical protein
MPEVLREGSFVVRVRFNEQHHYPHFHVYSHGEEAVVIVRDEAIGPELYQCSAGMKSRDARAAVELVRNHLDVCMAEWRKIHD